MLCLIDRDSASADNLAAHQKTPPNRQHKSPVSLPRFPLKDGLTDTTKLAGKFEEGQDVLARWSDGLFYLGTISKVCKRLCAICINVRTLNSKFN